MCNKDLSSLLPLAHVDSDEDDTTTKVDNTSGDGETTSRADVSSVGVQARSNIEDGSYTALNVEDIATVKEVVLASKLASSIIGVAFLGHKFSQPSPFSSFVIFQQIVQTPKMSWKWNGTKSGTIKLSDLWIQSSTYCNSTKLKSLI
jgi:hypothetical protein